MMSGATPTQRVSDTDLGTLRAMLSYTIKALNPEVLAQASGEDGVATLAHGVLVFEFIPQAQALEGSDGAQEVAQPGDVKAPIESAGLVAHANHHGAAPAVAAGFGFDGRDYLLIVGAWSCPVHLLRLHGSLSGCDVAMLAYAAKYLRQAGAMGDLI